MLSIDWAILSRKKSLSPATPPTISLSLASMMPDRDMFEDFSNLRIIVTPQAHPQDLPLKQFCATPCPPPATETMNDNGIHYDIGSNQGVSLKSNFDHFPV